MYKAINRDTNAEIVILEPAWADRLNSLRAWDRGDVLVCQECQQPVRVRAGRVRAWHFAHKHREDCPLGRESPQLLQARAALYRWLVAKFGAERVTLEKRINGSKLPRPVDCWVTGTQQSFAYWIFEAGLKPQRRDALHTALNRPDVLAHWLFLSAMLQQDEDNRETVYLTTTEREFMQSSEYDQPTMPRGGSLHYLDQETGRVTTYRGLRLKHSPQVFQGKQRVHPLDEILVSPKTGEFVHPGEHEQLQVYREEQQRQEKIIAKLTPLPSPQRPLIVPPPTIVVSPPLISRSSADSFPPSPGGALDMPAGICETCGEETRDWWYYDGKTGMCQCRKCQRKERAA